MAVLGLQMSLPKARVVYASATGASEPRNMAYMARLGLWGKGTSFATFDNFIAAVEKRGVGAMEIVARDMKLRGKLVFLVIKNSLTINHRQLDLLHGQIKLALQLTNVTI